MTSQASAAIALAVVAALSAPAHAAAPSPEAAVNRGVVELETGRAAGSSVRIAEDLANVIDDGATRRVLPVIGKGAWQNLVDLEMLQGVDMAIVQADVLDQARQQNVYPGIEYWLSYIAKLYNEEFHLLAGRKIKNIRDLANQKVNVDLRGAGTETTAARLFGLLQIPIVATNDDQEVALARLRKGEIAALAFVTGKPAPIFRGLSGDSGLHLLAIPLNSAVTGVYAPTRLTAEDYPGLLDDNQPVDTVAVGAILAAADLQAPSERYRNLVNFVDAFFTRFESLLQPGHHPKWREVNIATELPGWRRFPPAADWLRRNAPVAVAAKPQDLQAALARFLDQRQQASGDALLSRQETDQLFNQFGAWQQGQAH